jgi:hypothetical protein
MRTIILSFLSCERRVEAGVSTDVALCEVWLHAMMSEMSHIAAAVRMDLLALPRKTYALNPIIDDSQGTVAMMFAIAECPQAQAARGAVVLSGRT